MLIRSTKRTYVSTNHIICFLFFSHLNLNYVTKIQTIIELGKIDRNDDFSNYQCYSE